MNSKQVNNLESIKGLKRRLAKTTFPVGFLQIAVAITSLVDPGAAPFQNLDFEQANTNTLSYDSESQVTKGPIADLLPGWEVVVSRETVQLGGVTYPGYTNSLESLTFNSEYFDSPNVALIDQNWPDPFPSKTGNYSLWISPAQATITLIQRGEVPLDAESLRSFGIASGMPNSLITMNGVTLEPVEEGTGLDVSSFLGQNVELKIASLPGSLFRYDAWSFHSVPEPPPLALWLGAFLAWTGWSVVARKRRHENGKR